MNKAQKIVIACILLVMFVILIYPPIAFMSPAEGQIVLYQEGRCFIFSFPTAPSSYSEVQINIKKLIVELLAIGFLGGAFIILFSLKKEG